MGTVGLALSLLSSYAAFCLAALCAHETIHLVPISSVR
jgi:hypothetical protein